MEAWKVAISWYQDDQKDPSAALAVINRGIQIQNGNQFLWNEALKLQLTFVDKLKKEEERHRLCDKIKNDIDLMCQYIKDHNFLIEILHMLTAYRCSLPIQKYVIQILEKDHFDQDIVWHTLAQREKQGRQRLCAKFAHCQILYLHTYMEIIFFIYIFVCDSLNIYRYLDIYLKNN